MLGLRGSRRDVALRTTSGEELLEQQGGRHALYIPRDGDFVEESGILQHVVARSHRPGFFVAGADDDSVHSSIKDCSRTHDAGLEGD